MSMMYAGQSNGNAGLSGRHTLGRRSRSRSPVRRSRSRSRSPRDWKRSERRDSERGGSRRGGSMGSSNERVRLYVCNIPFDTRWQDLKDIFRDKVGNEITYVELYNGPDGKPTGAGVIEVRGRDLADKAIESMHRYEMKDRKIVVRLEKEKDRIRHQKMGGDMGGGGMGGGGMGGGGMGGGMGGGGMSNMGGGMGNMGGGMGNMGGGMGNMGNMGGGMGNMGGGSMGGGSMSGGSSSGLSSQVLTQLGIDPAEITCQVFVANLDYQVNGRKLKEIFRMAGNVLHAEIKEDKEGNSRGMGVVRFQHPMEAVQAISMFNGQILYERNMSVRMDKMAESGLTNQQQIPNRLPTGLAGVGMGLGAGGAPLQNISQLANTLTAMNTSSMGLGGGNQMGNMGTQMSMGNQMSSGMGGGMGGGMSNMGSAMTSLNSGMGGMGSGMGGMGSTMGGMSSGLGNQMSQMSSMGAGMGGMGGMGSMGGNMGSMGGNSMGSMNSGMGMGSGMGSGSMGGMGDTMSSMGGNMGGGGMSSSMGMGMGMDGLGGGMGGMGGGSGMLGGGMGGGSGGSRSPMGMSYGRSGGGGGGGMSTGNSILVKNLPWSTTWQELKEKFRECGDVKYVEMKLDNGRSTGCGTVRFGTSDDARKAVALMNGARMGGRDIVVGLEK